MDIEIVAALESGEELPESTDEVPAWDVGIDIESMLVVVEDGEEIDESVWTNSLFAAGRISDACDWRFRPRVLPAFVPVEEGNSRGGMAARMARVNNKQGDATQFHIFNPNFESDKEPAGAHLGCVSGRYFALPYEAVVQPLLDNAARNGWQSSVTAYNRGKKMRMDCDVAGVANTREEAAERLKGHNLNAILDSNYIQEVASKLHRIWKYGFTIFNSLDGTGSLRVQAASMRLLCANGQTSGTSRNLFTLSHNKGIMEPYDWDSMADSINDVIVEAQAGLVAVESMAQIPLLGNMFERLITLCTRRGLLSLPKEDNKGNLKSNLMWRLFGHGWTNPNESWVAVPEEQKGTLFHAYQVMSGAITHQPEWTDGESKLKGRKSGLATYNSRLRALDEVFGGLGHTIMGDAKEAHGQPVTGPQLLTYVQESDGLNALNDVMPITELLSVEG